MDYLRKKSYKFVSASAAVIENIAKPIAAQTHRMAIEGTQQVYGSVLSVLDKVEGEYGGKMSWFTRPLKKATRWMHQAVMSSLEYDHETAMETWTMIEQGLSSQQKELEDYFREKGIDVENNWEFSTENREFIRRITQFIKENTADCDHLPPSKVWQFFTAYKIMQTAARKTSWEMPYENEPLPLDQIADMSYFSKYAVGIYGKLLLNCLVKNRKFDVFLTISNEEILCEHANIKPEQIVFPHFDSCKYLPAHAVIVDHEKRAVVLAIRGTFSVFDCLTGLNAEYREYELKHHTSGEVLATGKVHKGIMQGAINIGQSAKPHVLRLLDENPEYQLVITGHSLGGGSTGLLALYWLSDPDIMRYGFRAFALAPPCTNSEEFTPFLKNCCVTCIYGNDVVTRASLGTIRDLCEVLLAFERNDKQEGRLTAGQIVSKKFYGYPVAAEDLLPLYNEIKSHCTSRKLAPPGSVFQVFRKKKLDASKLDLGRSGVLTRGKYTGTFLQGHFYHEIIFCKSMLCDHWPNLCEEPLGLLSGRVEPEDEEESKEGES